MSHGGLIKRWLGITACRILDHERDARIDEAARDLARAMRQDGTFFTLRHNATMLRIDKEDLALVKERVYELTLKHVLNDFTISRRDRIGLHWIARRLKLSRASARQIELRVGRRVFEEYLAFAISGGFLDDEELGQLQSLATSLGVTTRRLLLGYLAHSGEEFLYRLMVGMALESDITRESWSRLTGSLTRLGLPQAEFVHVLKKQIAGFGERVLAEMQVMDEVPEGDRRPLERLKKCVAACAA